MSKSKKYLKLMISVIALLGLLGCTSKVEKSVWNSENEAMKETITIQYNKDTVTRTEVDREIKISVIQLTEEEVDIYIKDNKDKYKDSEYLTYTSEVKDGIIYENIVEDMKKIDFKKLSKEKGQEVDYISYEFYVKSLKDAGFTEVKKK